MWDRSNSHAATIAGVLPPDIADLLDAVGASPRLTAHLRLVRGAAAALTEELAAAFPAVVFDRDAVLFGAATHDIGKAIHPGELSGPGSQHEETGYQVLLDHGIPAHLARFARTHGGWQEADRTMEDLLVTLADKIWKGKRVDELEHLVVTRITSATDGQPWETFMTLDDILAGIAAGADDRLAEQSRYPVSIAE